MVPDSKRCTKCGVDKPLPEFSKAPRGKYGLKSSCKDCDSRRAHANAPKRRLAPEEVKRRLEERRGDSKTCTKCGEEKPRSEFSKSRDGKHGPVLHGSCKRCNSERAMQWFADNPGRTIANKRKFNLAKNYGLTVADYDALLRSQNGVCAICGEDEPNAHGRTGKQFRLAVDHCHETGKVRGLLCQKCNRAIGLLKDDPATLRRAISYLLRHRKPADR